MKNLKYILIVALSAVLLAAGLVLSDTGFNWSQDRSYSANPSAIRRVSTDTTLTSSDMGKLLQVDASSAAISITLPAISPLANKSITIQKTDTTRNAVTVIASTADSVTNTIESSTQRVMLTAGYMRITNRGGTDWKVTGEPSPVTTDMTSSTYQVSVAGAYVPTLTGIGAAPVISTPTLSTVYIASDCGKTILVGTDALTFTLPSGVTGCVFRFINIGAAANNIVQVKTPGTGQRIFGTVYNGANYTTTSVISATTTSVITNTKATANPGDSIELFSSGTLTWIITRSTGTWTSV